MLQVLTFFFGSPLAILVARVASALCFLCPCAPTDLACEAVHQRVVYTVSVVAIEQRDPDEAAALLLGTAAHETGFKVELQANGGPAVSWWQIEVFRRDRAALLANPVAAARLALSRARACGGTMRGYAWGKCSIADPFHEQAAAELRHTVQSARFAMSR